MSFTGRLLSLIFSRLYLKVAAFVIAIVFWFFTAAPDKENSDKTEIQFPISITYKNFPKDLYIMDKLPVTANVLLSVGRNIRFNPRDLQFSIDLNRLTLGENRLVVTEDDIDIPEGVKILNIDPSIFQLTADRLVQGIFYVEPDFEGTPQENYIIGSYSVEPKTVTVTGPESVVSNLDKVKTEPINIQGLNSNNILKARINPGEYLKLDPNTNEVFYVNVRVTENKKIIRLDDIPVGFKNETYITKINPKTVSISLMVAASQADSLTPENFKVYIDLSNRSPGNYKVSDFEVDGPPHVIPDKVWPIVDVWILDKKKDQK